ncbi:hypothetical protein SUDANB95_02548 [Actinosynnema sp. ALI-1.44]
MDDSGSSSDSASGHDPGGSSGYEVLTAAGSRMDSTGPFGSDPYYSTPSRPLTGQTAQRSGPPW